MKVNSVTTHYPVRPPPTKPAPDGRPYAGQHVMPDGTVMDDAHHGHSHHAHAPAAAKPAAEGDQGQVEYTCPMHPQVRQMGPGNCPICGMTLEPVLATAEQGESPELRIKWRCESADLISFGSVYKSERTV